MTEIIFDKRMPRFNVVITLNKKKWSTGKDEKGNSVIYLSFLSEE